MKISTLNTFFLGISLLASGALGAMGKLKNPRAQLRPLSPTAFTSLHEKESLPSTVSTSPIDKISFPPYEMKKFTLKIANHIADGVLVRLVYKEIDARTTFFKDQYLKDPDTYTIKIKPFVVRNSTSFILTDVLLLDSKNNTIIKRLSFNDVSQIPRTEKIVLFSTGTREQKQVAPAETTTQTRKPMRRSPIFKAILAPLTEEDENAFSSEKTPSVSPTFSTNPTLSKSLASTRSSSLESLPESENNENLAEYFDETTIQQEPFTMQKTFSAVTVQEKKEPAKHLYRPSADELLMGAQAHQKRRQLPPLTNLPSTTYK